MTPLRRIDPTCPVQPLIGRTTTNLASGIHHEAYDCDNHNEAAEYAAKLEAGLLPSNINVLIFDHLVSAVEQRVWNGKSFKPHHMQPGFLCARERKLTLSVSSPGLHLVCAVDKDRIAGSAKGFAGKVEGTSDCKEGAGQSARLDIDRGRDRLCVGAIDDALAAPPAAALAIIRLRWPYQNNSRFDCLAVCWLGD